MLLIFTCVVVLVIIIGVIHFLIHNTRNAKLIDKLPGPKLLPVIGNGFDFLCNQDELYVVLRNMAKHGPICRIWIFHIPAVNIYNPSDAEIILSSLKYIEKSFTYDFFHPWLNEGLLTSSGKKWHQRRKILTPSFHFNILRQFCRVFDKQSNKLIEMINKELGKSEIDIDKFIRCVTLHSICETAMGVDLGAVEDEKKFKYEKAIHDMSRHYVHRMMRMWLYNPVLFSMSFEAMKQKKTLSVLHKFTSDLITERRILRNLKKSQEFNKEHTEEMGLKKRMAFLDVLLKAEDEGVIDENGIREEVDTFMFEGHDTITIILVCCLMELANHPAIQEIVVAEIKEVFPDPNIPISIEKLNNLHYMERCIKETLRLYPSVTSIGRSIDQDMALTNYMIPKGTTCFVHILDIQRNPEIYPEPEKFDPDRFLSENTVNRHPYAFIPFSAGPRNCIGQKFAMLEMKVIVMSMLRKFKLEMVTRRQDIEFMADIVLKPKNPIKIRVVPNV